MLDVGDNFYNKWVSEQIPTWKRWTHEAWSLPLDTWIESHLAKKRRLSRGSTGHVDVEAASLPEFSAATVTIIALHSRWAYTLKGSSASNAALQLQSLVQLGWPHGALVWHVKLGGGYDGQDLMPPMPSNTVAVKVCGQVVHMAPLLASFPSLRNAASRALLTLT